MTINRRDLVAIPIPEANLLWRDLHVRDVRSVDGKQRTSNFRIDITVEGVTEDRHWKCGLEYDYANDESFYCRPLRLSESKTPDHMPLPLEAGSTRIAFLSPMSGMDATETRLDEGAVNVRIGEGRTADVLRNLCFRVYQDKPSQWDDLVSQIQMLFGSRLDPPRYITKRGEIAMTYTEESVRLDLSSSGQGLQQTLLLLAYMYANPGSVVLLEEPDAHLEILRQRQICGLLTAVARESGSQVIAASHSEVLLNEVAGREVVISFDEGPHPIDDNGSQVQKALNGISFDQYYLAQQTGWVLYLKSSTDLAILQAFAKRLNHERAIKTLERPFVHYVGNRPPAVRRHFDGLREAYPAICGIALFDRLDSGIGDISPVVCLSWERHEIENYLSSRSTLLAFAEASSMDDVPAPLFAAAERQRRVNAMDAAIDEIESALKALGKPSPWSPDIKASDEFLDPLFASYFKRLDLPNLMAKKNFHELVDCVPDSEIDPEIRIKLDAIADVADSAVPAGDGT